MPIQKEKTFPQKNLHSMTGFGRGTASSKQISIQVELKALNNKYLEVRPKIPRVFASWEAVCRNTITRFLRRGSVEVGLNYQVLDPQLIHPINDAALKAYAIGINETSEKLGIPSGLNLTALLRLPGALTMDEGMMIGDADRAAIYHLMDKALNDALLDLLEMRANEGRAISAVIIRENENLLKATKEIRALAGKINEKLRERLQKRIGDLLNDRKVMIEESRLVQEVAFYSDRADVTEELDRLDSHSRQFNELLSGKSGFIVGKQLDFIVQEMLREANTIGSKSDDLRVTNLVVQLKLAIDRMREQVQNLE